MFIDNRKRIARFVKRVPDMRGDVALYQLTVPLDERDFRGRLVKRHRYVIVCSVMQPHTGMETYICPANEQGKQIGFGKLKGSYKGGMNRVKALQNAGYEVE